MICVYFCNLLLYCKNIIISLTPKAFPNLKIPYTTELKNTCMTQLKKRMKYKLNKLFAAKMNNNVIEKNRKIIFEEDYDVPKLKWEGEFLSSSSSPFYSTASPRNNMNASMLMSNASPYTMDAEDVYLMNNNFITTESTLQYAIKERELQSSVLFNNFINYNNSHGLHSLLNKAFHSSIDHCWREASASTKNLCNKIFASVWIDKDRVLFGTKDNKVTFLNKYIICTLFCCMY